MNSGLSICHRLAVCCAVMRGHTKSHSIAHTCANLSIFVISEMEHTQLLYALFISQLCKLLHAHHKFA